MIYHRETLELFNRKELEKRGKKTENFPLFLKNVVKVLKPDKPFFDLRYAFFARFFVCLNEDEWDKSAFFN